MSKPTLPNLPDDGPTPARPGDVDVRTDDGLRHALGAVDREGSWDVPAGQRLLAEIRRRGVRNAAHIAASAGVVNDRGLVDDVLLAAWLVLRRHAEKVLAADRPWAYVMSSAQKQVLDEVRARQLLTNAASIRGRAREVLPTLVCPVGSTATDLAIAFRHEPGGAGGGELQGAVPQVGRYDQPRLVTGREGEAGVSVGERAPWFAALIDLLVAHGADRAVAVAAVDRLADLFTTTYKGWWEWAARRDPILAQLGLTPVQCGALVALLAGSRRYRHNGKRDSLLAAVRVATEHGHPVELTADQLRRAVTFSGVSGPPHEPQSAVRELATAGCSTSASS